MLKIIQKGGMMKKCSILLCIAFLALTCFINGSTIPIANKVIFTNNIHYPIPFVPAQMLIMPKNVESLNSISCLNEKYKATMRMVGRHLGIYRIDFPFPFDRTEVEKAYKNGNRELLNTYKEIAIKQVEDMVELYENSGYVKWAAPNHYAYIVYHPNDTYFVDAPGFPNSSAPDQFGLYRVEANGGVNAMIGWDNTTGSSSILIGDTDSGLDLDDPDIEANLWTNTGEIPNNSIDDDGNGYVDDVHGYDFIGDWIGDIWGTPNEDSDPDVYFPDPACGNGVDDNLDGAIDAGVAHGTMTAGCADAVMDNNTGVTGACGHSQIVMARSVNPEGGGTDETIASGFDYLTTIGVDIINCSLGATTNLPATATAVTNAYNSGIAVICASGNSGDNSTIYPASMDVVLAVGSSNTSNARALFSSYGTWLDVVAPGGEVDTWPNPTAIQEAIWTTYVASVGDTVYGFTPGEAYIAGGVGTSFASPYTAGLAALIKNLNPGYSPDDIYNKIKNTAYDLPPTGFDQETGYGRVDFGNALAGIEEEIAQENHNSFSLSIAPNPSFSTVEITFNHHIKGKLDINIYDIRGRHIKTLHAINSNKILWDLRNEEGRRVAAGIYFFSSKLNGKTICKKITLFQ